MWNTGAPVPEPGSPGSRPAAGHAGYPGAAPSGAVCRVHHRRVRQVHREHLRPPQRRRLRQRHRGQRRPAAEPERRTGLPPGGAPRPGAHPAGTCRRGLGWAGIRSTGTIPSAPGRSSGLPPQHGPEPDRGTCLQAGDPGSAGPPAGTAAVRPDSFQSWCPAEATPPPGPPSMHRPVRCEHVSRSSSPAPAVSAPIPGHRFISGCRPGLPSGDRSCQGEDYFPVT